MRLELNRVQQELVAGYAFLAAAFFSSLLLFSGSLIWTHFLADAAVLIAILTGRGESMSGFENALRTLLAMAPLALIAGVSM